MNPQYPMDFTNDTINLSALPRYEEAAIRPLQSAYWNIILFNLSLFLVILAVVTVGFFWFEEYPYRYLLPFGIGYVLLAVVLLMVYRLSFKRRGLAVRDKDILFRSGLLSTTTTIVPFVRIQHVALMEGFLSRHYGMGSLQIFTAGGASGRLIIAGLDIEEAKKIKELVLNKLDQHV